jgi:hypothetical protein
MDLPALVVETLMFSGAVVALDVNVNVGSARCRLFDPVRGVPVYVPFWDPYSTLAAGRAACRLCCGAAFCVADLAPRRFGMTNRAVMRALKRRPPSTVHNDSPSSSRTRSRPNQASLMARLIRRATAVFIVLILF